MNLLREASTVPAHNTTVVFVLMLTLIYWIIVHKYHRIHGESVKN